MEQLPPHNMLDIIVLIIMALGLVQGLRRGLSGEMARLIGTIAAVWAGWYFYHPIGRYITENTRLSEEESLATSFFIAMLLIFLLMLMIRLLLGKIMEVTFKGSGLERLGGAFAGLLRTMFACAALLFFLNLLPSEFIRQAVAEHSFFGRIVTRRAPNSGAPSVPASHPGFPDLPDPEETSDDAAPSSFDPAKEVPATD